MRDGSAVVRNGKRALPKATGHVKGQLRRALDELSSTLELTGKLLAQTRVRLAGNTPDSSSRVVSLNDPDARPIRKGRLGKPVEFGYKAQVADNADGVILDHTVEQGAPPDGPMLAPAIERITRRAGRPPRAVTTDRGYGDTSVESDPHELGVKTVVIPRRAKPGVSRREFEHRRAFRKMVKWRTGSEGRISNLKRDYGWNRTPAHRPGRSPDPLRTRGLRPQPHQDRSPRRLTGKRTEPAPTSHQDAHGRPELTNPFQVEVASNRPSGRRSDRPGRRAPRPPRRAATARP